MESTAIAITGLSKIYPAQGREPAVTALENITLGVNSGEILVLLGPNGAGKSTLINILSGMTLRTSGSAKTFGYDVERDYLVTRRLIGVVPQETNYDSQFSTQQILEIQSGLMGVPPSERWESEIMQRLQLTAHRQKSSRSLSGGMKRRLLVAKALVHRPKILILDEPTAGVDIQLRKELWTFILDLHKQGLTILLTTHYLEEAERIADRIAFINHGKIQELSTLSQLKTKHRQKSLEDIYLDLLGNDTPDV